ncbi:hypothetical protein HN51_024536 [Arachis hypogaea]
MHRLSSQPTRNLSPTFSADDLPNPSQFVACFRSKPNPARNRAILAPALTAIGFAATPFWVYPIELALSNRGEYHTTRAHKLASRCFVCSSRKLLAPIR